jgi:hypothetical protein
MLYPELGWKRAITQFPYTFQLDDPSDISLAIPLQCWQATLPSQQEQ